VDRFCWKKILTHAGHVFFSLLLDNA
jgi:hypothetical protein